MSFSLSELSRSRLAGVHADLVKIVEAAIGISAVDFRVTEGLRSVDRQKALVAAGASSTMRSRHLTGHAVDLAAVVGSEIRWDWPLYGRIAVAMKTAARELAIPIEWGGDWEHFKDGPHFQLPWAQYP